MKVFIGVGHGGSDPGAVANGMRESDINLDMALELKRQLDRHGVQTAISRVRDENDSLEEEIKEAAAFAPDVAIDVHNNAGGGDGFEAFIKTTNGFKTKSNNLAKAIEKEVKAIGQNSRGIKTKLNSSGTDYFGFLRQINAVSVILEGAFVDNKTDAACIDTVAERKAFGTAYAKGVLAYAGIAWINESGGTASPAPAPEPSKTAIMGAAVFTAQQMALFCRSKNASPQLSGCTLEELAQMFLTEGAVEGVRGDVAFAQSLKETGYFKYGGIVLPSQNNYAGIGALNGNGTGQAASFPSPLIGVRAQIQHLKAYASTDALKQACVDPRFPLVRRGSAPYVEWLGAADNPNGNGWAVPGAGYGADIIKLMKQIAVQQTPQEPAPAPEEPAIPAWQLDGLTALIEAGIIEDSDYWTEKMSALVTVGEMLGLLGKSFRK